MSDDSAAQRERALRALPLPYSLALRLRDAGVTPDAICEYLDIDVSALAGLYRIAEAKLAAAQERPVKPSDQDAEL
ncbi:hypothetical protein [Mycobacterium shimoidei]|uniref:RNA polymerase sigma factor 70 region 4 type 2 domain-containing protein n=1 Tax=Mycobacterium shimoidei TaxID=29313 RepID=A0A1E3T5G4_MYCSH|nr:hypothetical protein [Mycobacterium shimoidei]MCV7258198.1 hypothetical protein [Mycobacterium shimoidei]ODR08938.1 hypothetical protein BHQ16_20215 [Mycobacterium shimoidei]ORW82311.1 hypothetical protein AWC26_05085 [Mycobacterium shimoidei]SRX95561.1 hypothetical protein MSP7336_03830 [Mycobacterium shimoidei]